MIITARELAEALDCLPNFNEFPGEYYRVELLPREINIDRLYRDRIITRTVEFKKQDGEWILNSLEESR